MLDIIRDFESICDRKIPDIIADIGKKNIVVWGSGEGGRVVKEKLERLGLDITYFVDTNYEEIIERYGKRVKSPQELNKETDYVIVSIVKVYTEIESYLRKVKGYQDNDYFYLFDNFQTISLSSMQYVAARGSIISTNRSAAKQFPQFS